MKTEIILSIFIFCSVILISSSCYFIFFRHEVIDTSTDIILADVTRPKIEYIAIDYLELELREIEKIAEEIASANEYKLHSYDCTEFSKALKNELQSLGYKAQCTAGNNWDYDYTNHTWVSVWVQDKRYEIEATQGYIIPDDLYESYEVNWENRCW